MQGPKEKARPKRRKKAKPRSVRKLKKDEVETIKDMLENPTKAASGRKIDAKFDDVIDYHILNLVDYLGPPFYRMGLSPNVFTTLSLIFALASGYFLRNKAYAIAGTCWFINYFFDSIDGNFARRYDMMSQFGDWYDHVTDYIGYALVCYSLIVACDDLAVALTLIIILTAGVGLACFHAKNEYNGQIAKHPGTGGSMSALCYLPSIDASITRAYGLGMNCLVTSLVFVFLPQIEVFLAHKLFITS
jgi:phosphatidylglycerophosphate synthase